MNLEQKKIEIWNYILKNSKDERPKIVTDEKLEIIKKELWQWEIFWSDIIYGHSLLERTPEELKKIEKTIYDHCIKRFWEMIIQFLIKKKLIS